jgi:hypothetical protein
VIRLPALWLEKEWDRMKTICLNLGVIFCLVLGALLTAYPVQAQTAVWPPNDFWNYPYDPSSFDWISFGLYDYPPLEWVCHWDFGDGTTYDECWVNQAKRFNQDGDYTVNVIVKNGAETVSISRVISIRTHDVAITRFTAPQSAKAGETRHFAVDVRNNRYPENVQVTLYKSTPDGDVLFGTLSQWVPVRKANRTTAFDFSYTFTEEDARIGKVTFKAVAILLPDLRDAWPADNFANALPTRVSR